MSGHSRAGPPAPRPVEEVLATQAQLPQPSSCLVGAAQGLSEGEEQEWPEGWTLSPFNVSLAHISVSP